MAAVGAPCWKPPPAGDRPQARRVCASSPGAVEDGRRGRQAATTCLLEFLTHTLKSELVSFYS